MKAMKVNVLVVKEKQGYSATAMVKKRFIATEGETFEELKSGILEALNLSFEDQDFTLTLDHIGFEFDLESFFDFYRVINVKALSERIGMNQSLLAQYIRGNKKPSPNQLQKILLGVHQIGRELTEVKFLL